MNGYVARRIERLGAAIERNRAEINDLQTQLDTEFFGGREDLLTALQLRLQDANDRVPLLDAELELFTTAPEAETTDEAAELAVLAWLWGPPTLDAASIAAETGSDLAAAVFTEPGLSSAGAAAVAQLIRERRPGRDAIPRILAVAGGEDCLDELVAAAVARRLLLPDGDRLDLHRDVVVLLPLRLETLFEEAEGQWTMLVRVVPDEASIRRDDPLATPTEVAALTTMWQQTFASLTDEQRAERPESWLFANLCPPAWEALCSRVGAPRAAWLAAAFPPVVADGAIEVDASAAVAHATPPNRVSGFPERIEIWCAFGSDAPRFLDATTVRTGELDFDVIGARTDDDGSVLEQSDRWWVSWPAAKDVGLGVEIVLPDAHTPEDITALYAVGLGDEDPSAHFRSQVDAGELAYLSLGAPTNAVNGEQAASLGHDAGDWAHLAWQWMNGWTDTELSLALTGDVSALPRMLARTDTPELDRTLVQALGPVLWGHHLRDIWGLGEAAEHLGEWAAEYLRPQGPFPPVRIGEQPYGVLPVSRMDLWSVDADEEGAGAFCEERMLPALLRLRELLAEGARGRGTAVGADTEGLLDLLGVDANSAGYGYRLFVPSELLGALYQMRLGVPAETFTEAAQRNVEPAEDLVGARMSRIYLGVGEAARVSMPLVVPAVWPSWFWRPGSVPPEPELSDTAGLARLLETLARTDAFAFDLCRELWGRVLPDSLLVRLVLEAGLLSAAAVVQRNAGDATPLLEPLIAPTFRDTRLFELAQAWSENDDHDHPAGRLRRRHVEGVERLYKLFGEASEDSPLTHEVDRAFRATLDTATHRVDPWITGMTNRRLRLLADQPDTRFRLGVYGWVEGPIAGAPGPTSGGLVHAPSHAQALTAAILRDKAISEPMIEPGGRDLWSMQLESARIRLADEIADEVRLGSHLYEVVGRQVERIVATGDGVRDLRRLFPLTAGRDDAGRVCSGVDAMQALLTPTPPIAVTAGQTSRLEALRDALDAYADLLVAEAVHQVVTGHADLAGAAMDAAAGLGAPPTLAFTETPLGGDGLSTAVIGVVPFAAPAAGDGAPPLRIADASVAAAVELVTGSADAWLWTAPDGASVSLAELGFEPIDTLAFSVGLLAAMAAHRLGSGDAPLTGSGAGFHERTRAWVRSLGSQPALASDLASTPGGADATVAAVDAAILLELQTRYAELRDEAQRTIDALTAANGPASAAALRRALRWGITPMVSRVDQQVLFDAVFDGVEPADPALLASLASRAAAALTTRLRAAPPVDARVPIGRSIAELAAPEGQCAVLSRIELDALRAVAGLTGGEDTSLDEDWLAVVAAVRPHVSRVEAIQLGALVGGGDIPAFVPVSSEPGDHWQTDALAALAAARLEPGGDPRAALLRFVAAYGLAEAWAAGAGAVVAVGLIDSWSESVPRTRQTSTAVFGFNAPAARPPQAILIAVPPDLSSAYGAPADVASLVDVLADTRATAHARAGHPEDLQGILAAMPSTMFPATPNTGVRFTGTSF